MTRRGGGAHVFHATGVWRELRSSQEVDHDGVGAWRRPLDGAPDSGKPKPPAVTQRCGLAISAYAGGVRGSVLSGEDQRRHAADNWCGRATSTLRADIAKMIDDFRMVSPSSLSLRTHRAAATQDRLITDDRADGDPLKRRAGSELQVHVCAIARDRGPVSGSVAKLSVSAASARMPVALFWMVSIAGLTRAEHPAPKNMPVPLFLNTNVPRPNGSNNLPPAGQNSPKPLFSAVIVVVPKISKVEVPMPNPAFRLLLTMMVLPCEAARRRQPVDRCRPQEPTSLLLA